MGLSTAWRMGLRRLWIELESLQAVSGLTRDEEDFPLQHNLLSDCKNLLSREWSVEMHHVCREANQVADGLAKHGLGMQIGVVS